MKQALVFIGLFLLLFTVSCKKKINEPVDLKYDYFQLVEGAFVEYDVTYMFHDVALLKHRYIRETSADSWTIKDVWIAIIIDGRAELVEENQRKVKMVFAPTEDKTWDINQFNMDGKVSASYDSIDVAKSIQGLDFNRTLIVREKNYTTLIDKIEKYEIYARGVGMIFKQEKDLKFNFGETIPNYGTEYYYRVNNYGIE